jgi:hypothetical protein
VSERLIQARFGDARAIHMLRRRPALSLRSVNGAAPLRCAAPRRRGFGPAAPVEACGARCSRCWRIERYLIPVCGRHAKAHEAAMEVLVVEPVAGVCAACGCTEDSVIEPCAWRDASQTRCNGCPPEPDSPWWPEKGRPPRQESPRPRQESPPAQCGGQRKPPPTTGKSRARRRAVHLAPAHGGGVRDPGGGTLRDGRARDGGASGRSAGHAHEAEE